MVAGNTKRIVVIKNISSNLIEEAIFILKSEPDVPKGNQCDKPNQGKLNSRNDFILKEAERIINEYISGNNLPRTKDRRNISSFRQLNRKAIVNTVINIMLMAAVALLIFIAGRAF